MDKFDRHPNRTAYLYPWLVIRHLPNAQCVRMRRFRKWNDADEFKRAMQRLLPTMQLEIVYDPNGD